MIRLAALLLGAAVLAGCLPGPPAPVASGGSCIGTSVESVIREKFAGTGDEDYMLHVAWRESGCEPCRFYPSTTGCGGNPRTAKGLFALLNHDDLIFGACPNPWGIIAWDNPACNAQAARWLYDGSGRSPWRL